VAVAQLAQLTLSEAALKQMHVAFICALLHNAQCEPSPIHQRAFFAGLSCLLPSCCVRLACWCRLVWLVPVSTGALVLAFGPPYVRASIWGSHIETPYAYKKQQLRKAVPFAFYGGPAAGRLRVLCLLLLLCARCSLFCCCCCCSCCSCFYCY
jgi:hypothetical protein